MKTLVLRSPFALTAPLPGTPVLPAFDPSLLFSFNYQSIVSSGGLVSRWNNAQGIRGSAGDMVPSGNTVLGANGVLFASNYMNTALFAQPLPVPTLTVLMRLNFSAAANAGPGNLFGGTDGAAYAYCRRLADGRLSIGVNGVDQIVTTQTAPSGQWVDIAVVFNGANTKVYINDGETTGTTQVGTLTAFRIGANVAGAIYLNAEVSRIQVYNRVIGADELKQIRAAL